MVIYFVRHGKDDENYRGGWSNLPLIEEGKEQINKLAIYLEKNIDEFNIQKIISSDLKRAKQTAEIINKNLNLPIEYTKRLREINNGEIAGMLNREVEKRFPGIYYKSLKINERYPGGESPMEFYNRIIKDFEDILEENKNIGNLMIITHSGVINIIYRYINNMKWSNKIKSIEIDNASIYSLRIENNKRKFELENFRDYLK